MRGENMLARTLVELADTLVDDARARTVTAPARRSGARAWPPRPGHWPRFGPVALEAGFRSADVATIAILQHRAAIEAHLVNEQLTQALRSRIVIEQAKGILAERAGSEGVSLVGSG